MVLLSTMKEMKIRSQCSQSHISPPPPPPPSLSLPPCPSLSLFYWATSVPCHRDQELCERRCGHPGLPVLNSPDGFCGRNATLNSMVSLSELRSCVKVEVAFLGSPSLTVLMVSVDVKQHWTVVRGQELCESRGGRPGLPVPKSPYGLYWRNATLNWTLPPSPKLFMQCKDLLLNDLESCVVSEGLW